MTRPWRLEIRRLGKWKLFATYTTRERAEAAEGRAKAYNWGVELTRVKKADAR